MKIHNCFFITIKEVPKFSCCFLIINTVLGYNSGCVNSFGCRQISYFDSGVLFLRRCMGPIICDMRITCVGVALIIHHVARKSVAALQGDVKQRCFSGDTGARGTLLCTMTLPLLALLKNLQDSISVPSCSMYVVNT